MTEEAVTEKTKARKKRHVSPSYPYLSLRDCVDLIKKLEKIDGFAEVPKENALKNMGLDPNELSTSRTLSSLKGFNLLEEKGPMQNRIVQLTSISKIIIFSDDKSSKQINALQTAALNYDIIKDLVNKWSDTRPPSEGSIANLLVRDEGFNKRAAQIFAPIFLDIHKFAKLGKDAILPVEEETSKFENGINGDNEEMNNHHTKNDPTLKEAAVPLGNKGNFTIKYPYPLSEQEFELVKNWLDLIKSSLVPSDNTKKVVNDD